MLQKVKRKKRKKLLWKLYIKESVLESYAALDTLVEQRKQSKAKHKICVCYYFS